MSFCCRLDDQIHYFDSESDAVDYVYETLHLGKDKDFGSRKNAVSNVIGHNVEISSISCAEDIEMLGRMLLGGNIQSLNMGFDNEGRLKSVKGD